MTSLYPNQKATHMRKCSSLNVLILAGLSIVLNGCTSLVQLPADGPTSESVYASTNSDDVTNITSTRNNDRLDMTIYTKDDLNTLKQSFPELPNPDLLLYVDKHLNSNGHPMSSFITMYRLYDRPFYALPGEITY